MLYRFDGFEVDCEAFELRQGGDVLHVEPLVFDLIRCFAEHPETVLSRDDLVERVWGGRIVSDATISSCIKSARRALGDSGAAQTYIRTVRGRGFRFAGDVEAVADEAAPDPASPEARADTSALARQLASDSQAARTLGDGAAGAAFAERLPEPATTAPADRPVLAVMPFGDLSAEAVADMFADGVVEEITAALSRSHEVYVIARQSSFALAGSGLESVEIARRLGATYLLEGTVRRARQAASTSEAGDEPAGDRVRISVQLVDGATAHTTWSLQVDDSLDDLFDLQDRIAEKVVGALSPGIRRAEIARARASTPAERSAYDLLLTAYPHFWAHRKEENARALALLDEALAQDPHYARALALKGWAQAQQTSYIWSEDPAADREAALEAAEAAIELAEDDAPTLVAIGAALTLTTPDQDRAKRFIDRALMLDPNNAWGWMRKGWIEIHRGNYGLALTNFDQAAKLSPLDPFFFNIQFGRAIAHELQGELDEAIRLAMQGLEERQGVTWAWRLLVRFHTKNGDTNAAAEALGKLREAYPALTISFLRESLPPAIANATHDHFADLRAAGLPD